MGMPLESLLNKDFVKAVNSFKTYLKALKARLESDGKRCSEKDFLIFFSETKKVVYPVLDNWFEKLWDWMERIDKNLIDMHKKYAEKQLLPFLYEGVEINEYIRKKPLGYAGDYIMMNYIYDYHDGNYLGETAYQKLINNYTCNTAVATSNFYRKEYLKDKIVGHVFGPGPTSILSVGCGPAREIIELLKDGSFKTNVTIHLLDIEKGAIKFVQDQLQKIAYDKNKITINFYMLDLIQLVKSRKIQELFRSIDFVYVSGVLDYLSNRVAKRVVSSLYSITGKELVVFNISLENARHRMYYEVLGEWVMFHRGRQDLLEWGKTLEMATVVDIEDYPKCACYWILKIGKADAR